MKKAYLSLFIIITVVLSTVTITRAYFSDTKVLGDSSHPNIFATGTVLLNEANTAGFPIQITGMVPGKMEERDVKVRYMGTADADMFIGVGGSRATTDPAYIADKLYVWIDQYNGTTFVKRWFEGYADVLSTQWEQIAQNIPANQLMEYKVSFKLDADLDNTYQNQTNDDTVFLLYAVQTGQPVPTTMPWQQYAIIKGWLPTPTP